MTAVEPTFSAMTMIISRNLGCMARPTALRPWTPASPGIRPTMTWSAMLVSWARISSSRLGQAMMATSRISSRLCTPSGMAVSFFRAWTFSAVKSP